MSQLSNSAFYYCVLEMDDLCPDCGNLLIRCIWNDKEQRLVDECSECGKIVEYTVDVSEEE